MTRHKIRDRIITSFSASYNNRMNPVPQQLTAIKEACRNIPQEDVMPAAYVQQKRSIFNNPRVQWTVALSLMVFLLVTCIHLGNLAIRFSTMLHPTPLVAEGVIDVIIDVNPSIELVFDKDHKVVSCEALNEDAENILENIDLVGTNSNVAFNTIVGVLYLNGYLQGSTDAMLVSVDSEEDTELEKIENVLSEVMENSPMTVTVLIQSMEKDKLEEEAEKQQISPGKLELINRIVDLSEDYTNESVSELSTESIQYLAELYRILSSPLFPKTEDDTESTTPEPATPESITKVVDETLEEAGKLTEDSLNEAGQIVEDTLNTAGQIVEDTLNTAGDIVEDTLNTAGEIVEDTLKTTEEIVEGSLETADKIIEESINSVTEQLKRIFIIIH